jgi:SAM-dependent methyltransferase
MNFYVQSLRSLLAKNILLPDDSVLVLAGGPHDRVSLLEAGFSNVVISNLDFHPGDAEYAPFSWVQLDAERIERDDESYDWVVIHAGLHHLGVPAQGVCEMFRVCRKGILCFEARDSLAMRLALKVSLSSAYELEPAFLSGGHSGGYRNGLFPRQGNQFGMVAVKTKRLQPWLTIEGGRLRFRDEMLSKTYDRTKYV